MEVGSLQMGLHLLEEKLTSDVLEIRLGVEKLEKS
jgi:hypothetical protein